MASPGGGNDGEVRGDGRLYGGSLVKDDRQPGRSGGRRAKVAQAAGGKLEQFFWSFGDDDYLAIIDAPDDISAAAVSIAVGSSGSLRNLRTIRLITPEEGRQVLEKAKAAKAAYSPPGAKTAAGVRS